IKRPPNAFIIFRSHCCAPDQQLSELGITDHRHISRIVSHLWKSLKPAEKAYWEQKAQQKKDEHAAAHPDYRYKP
ncbi:high mobility group box domain-containing protein, partial [Leucosporidium creatinivorum]